LEDEEDALDQEEADEASYVYDDDMYSDEYWSEQDWGSVWGDYSSSCYKLFDANLEKVKFNPERKPGNDDWPFLNIYGNCETCEAYIVDIYTTEHFRHVQTYKVASLNYGLAAAVFLILTIVLAVRRRFAPKSEKEASFLSYHGGRLA